MWRDDTVSEVIVFTGGVVGVQPVAGDKHLSSLD
jgi:hypothetical protein